MNIVITGASSQIGYFLLPKLIAAEMNCYPVSRKQSEDTDTVQWVEADLATVEKNFFLTVQPVDVWIHLAPLTLVNPWLEKAASAGVKRFIGFSTTSIFTKKDSSNAKECQFITDICNTEAHVKSFCDAAGINWTLFRPTLIYGCGRDKNIAFIQKMINRFGFFPVVGGAQGKRQPVHADDLADACFAALQKQQTINKAYNLSGGETLTYRAMVERVFQMQNKSPRIISLPIPLLKGIIYLLAFLPPWKYLNPAMVDRINLDMVFDHAEATQELNYAPRLFLPTIKVEPH